jgi:hypothetical protein
VPVVISLRLQQLAMVLRWWVLRLEIVVNAQAPR